MRRKRKEVHWRGDESSRDNDSVGERMVIVGQPRGDRYKGKGRDSAEGLEE